MGIRASAQSNADAANHHSHDESVRQEEGIVRTVYFSDVVGVVLRRWYILLIGLLLIATGAGVAYYKVPPDYQASGELLLLLPPQATGNNSPTNPYLNLQPGLTMAATLIASTVSNPEEKRHLSEQGFAPNYSVTVSPGGGPLILISVESQAPDTALATRDKLIERLQEELVRIQDEESVPSRQLIHTRTNSATNEAELLQGSKLRALAGIVALGGVITLIAMFLIDRTLLSRRPRGTQGGDKSGDPDFLEIPQDHDDKVQRASPDTSQNLEDAHDPAASSPRGVDRDLVKHS